MSTTDSRVKEWLLIHAIFDYDYDFYFCTLAGFLSRVTGQCHLGMFQAFEVNWGIEHGSSRLICLLPTLGGM